MAIYSDFDFSFGKDIYGNLKKQINLQAIKQSIKQILLTPIGSIRYNLEFGSNVHKALFEKINPVLEILLKQEIIFALENWEPRISVKDVIIDTSGVDSNIVIVNILYEVLVTKEENEVEITLVRRD